MPATTHRNDARTTVRELLAERGRTYAAEAGIRIADKPQPLYRLLVLANLLGARIRADAAIGAARALSEAGLRDPRRMADASRQQRVDALGAGGYRRYDERTSRQLREGARLLLDTYGGDLRRLRTAAAGDLAELRRRLGEFPGMGPTSIDIFLREVQSIWPEVAPRIDGKALEGARRLGLPNSPAALSRLVPPDRLAPFADALVRTALTK